MSDNPITAIPDTKITWEYMIKSDALAKIEKKWTIMENQRLPVLAEITSWYTKGSSHTAAEAKARTTKEYQEFLTSLGEARADLIRARAKVKALDFEIRTRLNRSYQDRVEHKSGGLQT